MQEELLRLEASSIKTQDERYRQVTCQLLSLVNAIVITTSYMISIQSNTISTCCPHCGNQGHRGK
jgi:hypothetical protein